jgi:hypothetical protein
MDRKMTEKYSKDFGLYFFITIYYSCVFSVISISISISLYIYMSCCFSLFLYSLIIIIIIITIIAPHVWFCFGYCCSYRVVLFMLVSASNTHRIECCCGCYLLSFDDVAEETARGCEGSLRRD